MPEAGVRTLVLLRHAKSDWPVGVPDIDRPLAERGRRDAPAAARWLADEAGLPDLIVTSPALRTRQTVDLLLGAWKSFDGDSDAPAVDVQNLIYEASTHDLTRVVSDLPDSASRVLMVGHNPGLEEFAGSWPMTADSDAARRLSAKFPTCAVALVDIAGSWSSPVSSRLTRVEIPRG